MQPPTRETNETVSSSSSVSECMDTKNHCALQFTAKAEKMKQKTTKIDCIASRETTHRTIDYGATVFHFNKAVNIAEKRSISTFFFLFSIFFFFLLFTSAAMCVCEWVCWLRLLHAYMHLNAPLMLLFLCANCNIGSLFSFKNTYLVENGELWMRRGRKGAPREVGRGGVEQTHLVRERKKNCECRVANNNRITSMLTNKAIANTQMGSHMCNISMSPSYERTLASHSVSLPISLSLPVRTLSRCFTAIQMNGANDAISICNALQNFGSASNAKSEETQTQGARISIVVVCDVGEQLWAVNHRIS